MRYLFWIGLLLIIYLALRKVGKRVAQMRQTSDSRLPEQMVTCAHCGVNLPISESLSSGQHYFCSEEHQLAEESQKNE